MVRGGGSLVIPMLMALDRLGSRTINSLFLTFSCCFYQHRFDMSHLLRNVRPPNFLSVNVDKKGTHLLSFQLERIMENYLVSVVSRSVSKSNKEKTQQEGE